MRIALALICLVAAAPAVAQVSTASIPSDAGAREFARLNADAPQIRYFDWRGQEAAFEDNIRRAGAWGQCVAAAAPEASRAYLATAQTTARLRWNFERCQRKVGQFDGASVGRVRRAALIDALRIAS